MKKFLIVVTLLLLSSCTFGQKTPTSFEDYYTRNARATIDSAEKRLESLGLFRSTETSGIFDVLVSVPVLLSGSLMTEYNIQSDGRNASLSATDGKLQYEGITGSGFLSFDKIGLISEAGNLHLLYDNLQDLGLSTPEMREVFAKFDGIWLSYTQKEARASITDPTELQAMDMIENLSKMDKKQVEKYLTEYPIWQSTEDVGMSGALHVYRVELNRAKILELMSVIKADLTGSGFSTEDQSALREQLARMNISGTMAFHPDHTDVTGMNISLTDGSGTILGTLSSLIEPKKTQITITSTQDGVELNYIYTDNDTRHDMNMVVSQSGIEMMKMTGYMDGTGKKFRELGLDITAQGITVTLKHTEQEDGKFDGRLLLPVGSLSWNGMSTDKKLTALSIQWASSMGAMNMDLTSSGEMIRGPFVLRVGEEEVMRAIVGMIAESERFRLSVDVPQGQDSAEMIHWEFWITMKRSDFSSKISAPSWAKPLSEMLTELEKIAPEAFTEEPQREFDESSLMTTDGIDSLESTNSIQ